MTTRVVTIMVTRGNAMHPDEKTTIGTFLRQMVEHEVTARYPTLALSDFWKHVRQAQDETPGHVRGFYARLAWQIDRAAALAGGKVTPAEQLEAMWDAPPQKWGKFRRVLAWVWGR